MSDQAVDVFEAVGEMLQKHMTEDGIDVPAIHQEMIETLMTNPDVTVETLEMIRMGVMAQAEMFCHVLDPFIEEKKRIESLEGPV